jgi:endoglucanase
MDLPLRRGTNISHWLSQSKRRGDERRAWFTRDDVKKIAGYGFDHIRLPIDEEQMWTEAGATQAEAFDLLDAALDWCEAEGLRVIVDLHILRSHYFMDADPPLFADPARAQQFADFWRQLSRHLRGRREDRVWYELMNEPVARDNEDWNRVAMVGLAAIRGEEPTRQVLLGSNKWSQCATFDALRVPPDPNLVLTFHFYGPITLTHYKAGWNWTKDYTGPVQYPGVIIREEDLKQHAPPETWDRFRKDAGPYGRDDMVAALAKPLAVAARTKLPLYCGEFGCYNAVPLDVRQRWYRDLISVFDQFAIGWGNWDYKGSFGIVDGAGHDTGIAAALLGS